MLNPRPVLERLMAFLGEDWDEAMLAHAAAESPFRDATRFAQNPEALGAVALRRSAAGSATSMRATGASSSGSRGRLVELEYATDDAW